MSDITFSKQLAVQETSIPGLLLLDLPVHGDSRGWFKENWQREKMVTLGLPDFRPIQNNFSFNDKRGVARGIHAEPWDKFVSLGQGRIFGAWVDIRAGSPTYGQVFTAELDPSRAIYVPAGVANSYQTLEDNTVYSYLVNDHWSADAQYTFVNLADESLGIQWPIPLNESEISDKDKHHPLLKDITPMPAKKILVTGANGQLGKALAREFPDAEFVGHSDLDITADDLATKRNWRGYGTIINAAAYTAVDAAESSEGRVAAWQTNAVGAANLARLGNEFNLTVVHVSSDYVFDGTIAVHGEDEPFSPLGVYGQSKAAGDLAIETVPKHYIVRTSWVIGDGKNFVRTMLGLGAKGVSPTVVADQIGRLSFTDDVAKGIKHLLSTNATYGTYNLSNEGDPASWADITREIFKLAGYDLTVTDTTTAEYFAGKEGIAPRPLQSTLDLAKIRATGFVPSDWRESLARYIEAQPPQA